MAIIAYTGLPRSGKSYSAVEQVVLPALDKGRVIYTNLPLNLDAIRRDYKDAQIHMISVEALLASPELILEIPAGAVVLLDEVWRLWPAGAKVHQIPEPFKSFLAEHGHRVDVAQNAQQIVLVTQDLAQLAAFARQLVEQTFRTVKLTTVGMSKKFRTDVYQGAQSGQNPPQSARLRQIFGRYRPQIYQYYTSHTMSEAAEGGANESAADGRGNVLLRPMVLLSPLLVIGLIVFGVRELHAAHGLRSVAAQSRRAGGAGSDAPLPGARLEDAFPRALGSSKLSPPGWRVSGWFRGSPPVGGYAWVTDGRVTVWVPLKDCRESVGMVSCPYAGHFWAEDGREEEGVSAPLGGWSSGPSLAPVERPTASVAPVRSQPRLVAR